MKRRKFINRTALGAVAWSMLSPVGVARALTQTAVPASMVPLSQPISQIRHGAFSLSGGLSSTPFDWLLNVNRNIFFQNGFQRNEEQDLEIVSLLLQDEAENTEALQVQLKREVTTIMWKDNFWDLPHLEGLWKVNSENDSEINYQLYLASIPAGEILDCSIDAGEIFVAVLAGRVALDGAALHTEMGIGLFKNTQFQLDAKESSRVLLIARK